MSVRRSDREHGAGTPDRARSTARLVGDPGRRFWLLCALLAAAFVVTRMVPAALTLMPELHGPDVSDPTRDLARYAGWASQVVGDGLVPYRDVAIEYPPGSLPFVLAPALLGGTTFSVPIFVALMIALDAAAFAALLAMARRGTSWAGVVTWLVLPPALGVLMYARLDLIPSVALVLALERAHARSWLPSGVWLGLAAAAKLFPALLVPLVLIAAAGGRVRLLAGVALGGIAAWLPFAADTGALVTDVLGYHGSRGIHLESLWGSLLNLQRVAGGPAELVYEYGAFHITGPAAPQMLRWTTELSVAVVVAATAIGLVRWWRNPERAHVELPLAITATLALLLGTGRVLSPQFIIWLLAAGAVMVAVTPRVRWWAMVAMFVIVALTVAGYPFGFDLLRAGERWPALVLLWRNVVLIAFGVALTVRWLAGIDDAPVAVVSSEHADTDTDTDTDADDGVRA